MLRPLATTALAAALAGCAPERQCASTLWYTDEGQAEDVVVVGDFNDWDPTADRLREQDPGAWSVELELEPGDYAYMFQVDGRAERDLYAPLLEHRTGGASERSLLRVEDCREPELLVQHAEATAMGVIEAGLLFLRGHNGPRLDEDSVRARTLTGHRLQVTADASVGGIGLHAKGLPEGKHTVVVTADDRDGRRTQARIPLWVEPSRHTWADALVYQVMIDRFADEQGALPDLPDVVDGAGARAGGTLQGVHDKLTEGWFAELGVTTLWLSPVYPVPDGTYETLNGHEMSAYHGYWPVSHEGVEPSIGSEEDLRALIEDAHQQGIRVVLDVIPNHVHELHPWWIEGDDRFHELGDDSCVCGTASCPWDENIETCWFADYMPDLDWDKPGVPGDVADAIRDTALRWDLDGLRIDAVPMVPRAAVREVAHGVNKVLESGGPTDFLLLGETFTGPDGWGQLRHNLGPHGLDSQFDFPFMWALRGWLAWDSADAADVAAVLETSRANWEGSGATMALFVGNHDVSRFLSEADGANTGAPWTAPPSTPARARPYRRLGMAQLLAMTLPGLPVIWQGDELGMAGATDPDCRRPMRFSQEDGLNDHQLTLLDVTRVLGQARSCSKALRRGELDVVFARRDTWVHIRDAGNGQPAIVVLNAGDTAVMVELDAPALKGATDFRDVLGSMPPMAMAPGATTTLQVPPDSAALFLPTDSACAMGLPRVSLPEDP